MRYADAIQATWPSKYGQLVRHGRPRPLVSDDARAMVAMIDATVDRPEITRRELKLIAAESALKA